MLISKLDAQNEGLAKPENNHFIRIPSQGRLVKHKTSHLKEYVLKMEN